MKAFQFIAILVLVSLVEAAAVAQGVDAGSKEYPLTAIYGDVRTIAQSKPSLKLESTKLEAKLSGVYYEGTVQQGGLVKPTSGEVQQVTVGDLKVELANMDFSNSYLDTKEFGRIALFFSSSLTSERCILAVTDEQLKKIQAKVKRQAVE
jgi:hypothetical protein